MFQRKSVTYFYLFILLRYISFDVLQPTCFMSPLEVKSPQISMRDECFSFASSPIQERVSFSPLTGSVRLTTALSMLVLHWGSLYKVDITLIEGKGEREREQPTHYSTLSTVALNVKGSLPRKTVKCGCSWETHCNWTLC